MDQKKIGCFVKKLRKEKGLTQEQLAEKLNVSGRTVSRWETGNNMPDLSILIELADFFDVDIREIIDGERKSEKMDKEQQDVMLKVADYSNQKERLLLKKVYAVVISGIFAWIISFILAFKFSNSAVGVEILLLSEGSSVLLYCLCMSCVKVNRSAYGYISTLIGAFVAVVSSNIALLTLFFRTGDYHNHGIIGVYYTFLTFVMVFTAVGIITTLLNKKNSKHG